ncbi:MAG: pyridoxal 5'-phosphate synthase glutaminase subunit PdxT [Candidatus Bipolaricaulota bacterium]|nr:pyridoxal 5'-phosphate synthase glutaminase subunit PdxT [Candidatus Bipolaricaulota bacterium]MCX7844411.1 pyridoxal 5'-phosphate synthase glutaminase subunit PdxT [Candidatus Bipolaricaulota bacterium]MDW8151576.1 pyridoxal 5'-phosphate synthase glutaminase subunit PdxT [Candidatus Bipolaricaulota bacterium]
MKIGVLAVQGAAREHLVAFGRLGVAAVPVLRPADLAGLDGIVLPGGESTAQWRLLSRAGLGEPLRAALLEGLPAFGTCAGLILLAREITNWPERYFGVLDVAVERNATGRQVDSFEARVRVDGLGEVPAVFIRAPAIRRVGPGVEVLGTHAGEPVLVRQGSLLGATFHPELTEDLRVHELFLGMCRKG